jgi:gas vesicle protein
MNDNSNDLGAFLAGFVIGGLVGAAVALILTPQSGEETRRRLSDMSSDLRNAGQERIEQAREAADSYTHRAGEAISDIRGQAGQLGEQIQEQTRIVLDAGKESADSLQSQVNDQNGSAS